MHIRLYVDEDAMARALVSGLRARGVDVTTVLEEGRSEQTDADQLGYAAQQGRVLYTLGEQIRRLLRLINNHSTEEMRNNLHFL